MMRPPASPKEPKINSAPKPGDALPINRDKPPRVIKPPPPHVKSSKALVSSQSDDLVVQKTIDGPSFAPVTMSMFSKVQKGNIVPNDKVKTSNNSSTSSPERLRRTSLGPMEDVNDFLPTTGEPITFERIESIRTQRISLGGKNQNGRRTDSIGKADKLTEIDVDREKTPNLRTKTPVHKLKLIAQLEKAKPDAKQSQMSGKVTSGDTALQTVVFGPEISGLPIKKEGATAPFTRPKAHSSLEVHPDPITKQSQPTNSLFQPKNAQDKTNSNQIVSRREPVSKSKDPIPTTASTAVSSRALKVMPVKHSKSVSKPPAPVQPQVDIVEWISASVVSIPPVFKANVEFSKQQGFFLVVWNTHNGTTRCYNEDRIKITAFPDQMKKKRIGSQLAPDTLALFSVFDGHGSFNCSQYLTDRLHTVLLDKCYPDIDKLQVQSKSIYAEVDNEFKKHAAKINENFAGSCACTLLIYNKSIQVLNLGDSRCVLSRSGGTEIRQLSTDHKPSNQEELERIVKSGGFVFRAVWDCKKRIEVEQKTTSHAELVALRKEDRRAKEKDFGPWRVSPGGLSVSRCFGDFECKGGPTGDQPVVVSTEPSFTEESLENADFALIGCLLISRRNI